MARNAKENKAKSPIRTTARSSAAKKPVAQRRSRSSDATPYHHGDLHDALLKAAERVLERDGLPGLTLRAVAREAGVSHAAPTHHFGDLTGLVSELAAIGYRHFSAAMLAGRASGTVQEQGLAAARAYVAFAQAHPGMYGLMFRAERLDMSRPSLHEASDAAFAGLARGVGASRHEHIAADAMSLEQGGAVARAWSMVHGFTMLLLDGRLIAILQRLPKGTTMDQLFEAMLKSPGPRPPVS
ncbi:TetR/AcrR family transcriptional regulator [Bradyrhizobium lablabi]|uniref:TetR/AcrR family transcriptional regulator n=1 Tax=Bradyrhizobium lablabi TaxID=722472 RepID=UPI001BA89669|nr:TetR/AcrR family transcriptional regulator [Bradyrhizobium lablabi]MBR1124369.1 TetR/AcrR family transcriptional regulator [Bradyrhizobium lablabi]